MFNSLFAEETGQVAPEKDEQSMNETGGPSTSSGANPLLNFWSVATAVTNTVKARADELVKSVVDTDWRSELSQFSREVGEESKTLKEKTAELVEHLPEQVVHLPEKAEEALHHLPAQVHLPKDVGETIEGVSVAFAQLGKSLFQGTKELIDELKDGVDAEIAAASREGKRAARGAARGKSSASGAAKLATPPAKYSRFEAEVAAMQRDSSTYCDEPEDAEDYARWRQGFSLAGVQPDIARITGENAFMAELQSRLVPIIVEHQDFWSRYFYRLHKLQQKEEQRQQLAQRAKSLHEDEVPLGWGDEEEAAPATQPAASERGQAPQAIPVELPRLPAEPEITAVPSPIVGGIAGTLAAEGSSTAEASADSVEAVTSSPAAAAADAPAPLLGSEPERTAASSPAVTAPEAPVEGGAEVQQAGSSSALPAHADTEAAGPAEAETHAETSSDSSAKEWCVVKTDAKPAPSPSAAAAVAAAASPAEADFSRSPAEEAGSPGGVASASPEWASPAAAVSAGDAVTGGASGPASPVTTAEAEPEADVARAAPRRQGAGGVKTAGDEEEVDEDWGNWD